MKYEDAAGWFNEVEGFAMRSERLYAEFAHLGADDLNRILLWCLAAFEAARAADQPSSSATDRENDTHG